jgi:hypothetical protein
LTRAYFSKQHTITLGGFIMLITIPAALFSLMALVSAQEQGFHPEKNTGYQWYDQAFLGGTPDWRSPNAGDFKMCRPFNAPTFSLQIWPGTGCSFYNNALCKEDAAANQTRFGISGPVSLIDSGP